LKKLKEMLRDVTFEELGRRIGMSRKHIWEYLALLGLTPELQQLVSKGKLKIESGAKLKQLSEEEQNRHR